jgi:serine/threonine protein kinase
VFAAAAPKFSTVTVPVLQRDVAIKVLPIESAKEPGYRERFRREALTAARLNEQHIIPIHDIGEIDGHLYLVMPIIHGVDLGNLLHQHGPLSPQRAVRIIDQLAQALDAAHTAGLVHRDVKPSNALITDRDNAYLIDFGIAHDAAATKITSTGFLMGTVSYMAPERYESGTADARADVYGLACVLYECLTATLPFPGPSLPQQMHAHLYADPPRPSAQQYSVPTGFDEVIARGMAKNPDVRYQTATELANAAERALLASASANTFQAAMPPKSPQSIRAPRYVASAPAGTFPPSTPRGGPNHWSRQRLTIAAAISAIALIAVSAVAVVAMNTHGDGSHPSTAAGTANVVLPSIESPPSPTTPPPVTLGQLEQLLISPADIATEMGVAAMAVTNAQNTLGNNSNTTSPPSCKPVMTVGNLNAYADSGWTDARGQTLSSNDNNGRAVDQVVVLFPK